MLTVPFESMLARFFTALLSMFADDLTCMSRVDVRASLVSAPELRTMAVSVSGSEVSTKEEVEEEGLEPSRGATVEAYAKAEELEEVLLVRRGLRVRKGVTGVMSYAWVVVVGGWMTSMAEGMVEDWVVGVVDGAFEERVVEAVETVQVAKVSPG